MFIYCYAWVTLTLILHLGVPPQYGDIRLVGGTANQGRLELFYGVWVTVCYNSLYDTDLEKGAARTACRQLGYEDMAQVGSVTDMK